MSVESSLRTRLRRTGLTTAAITAAWPQWWSEDAEASPSAVAELHFSLARQLGMSPSSLLEAGEPRFLWTDETRYKNLGTTSDREAAVLSSFSISVARCAIAGTPRLARDALPHSATELRAVMLGRWRSIGLRQLVVICWAYGIPVLQLKVFPLPQKRMHAVTARLGDRFAVLIGHESRFQSQVAFWLAHELGHICSDHVDDSVALVDVDDPLRISDPDEEEQSADRFALELLTGDPAPLIEPDTAEFTATQLASAVQKQGEQRGVDPGVLALCLGHSTGTWDKVMGALKILGEADVARLVNDVAQAQIDWPALTLESRNFLAAIIGTADG